MSLARNNEVEIVKRINKFPCVLWKGMLSMLSNTFSRYHPFCYKQKIGKKSYIQEKNAGSIHH